MRSCYKKKKKCTKKAQGQVGICVHDKEGIVNNEERTSWVMIRKLLNIWRKVKLDSHPLPHTVVDSRGIKNLNVKDKVKKLKKKIRRISLWLRSGVGKDFLKLTVQTLG